MRTQARDGRDRFDAAVVLALTAALLPALYGLAGLVLGVDDNRPAFAAAFVVAGAVAALPWLVLREGEERQPAAGIALLAVLLAAIVLLV